MTSWFRSLRPRASTELKGAVGPVNHVALGTFCHVATALRDLELRRWTGPFDWIFSTPAMVADCLDDDFAALLDPRHLRSVPPAELTGGAKRQCRHVLYEGRFGLPTLFNHHDPTQSPADLSALERAVGRMRLALDGSRSNTFYMMSERAWPADEIAAVEAALAARSPRFVLAVITVEPEARVAGWSATSDGRIRQARLTVRSRSRGTRFADPADDALLADAIGQLAGVSA